MFDDAAWAVNSAVECYPHTVEVRGSNPLPPTITAERFPPWSFYLKIEVPPKLFFVIGFTAGVRGNAGFIPPTPILKERRSSGVKHLEITSFQN